MEGYCTEQINEGIFKIACPFNKCDKKLNHGRIVNSLTDPKQKKLFEKMIIDSMSDPHLKTCPGCSKTERITDEVLTAINKNKRAWLTSNNSTVSNIKCEECNLQWCFSCHAPWHQGMSCSTYKKGDKAFNQWMNWRSGQPINAHYCPKCKIPIQRASGCPSMVCSYCNVSWCYDCGQSKAWDNTVLGPHYSKLAFKGCLTSSYLYFNSIPLTYLIRTGALAFMLAGFFILGLIMVLIGVPILPLLLLGGFTVIPIYAVLRKQKPISGRAPYTILSDCLTYTTRFGMISLVISLCILLGPITMLSGLFMSRSNSGLKFLNDIGLIEDDDEFDEFPSENWDQRGIDQEDDQLWQNEWDANEPQDSFFSQLRAQLENMGHKISQTNSQEDENMN
ncbi:hypothetical protein LOD99_16085 [Oopsacas minuta]|uniref:26S proteasome complex subunit SEM1 n=1 Tax=Oopsacas minuta TaxID=111878 RepID=A0AAV7K615_9METZ|nr:hypothetical protein LOD99_16085 [Oopsacas minuta]